MLASYLGLISERLSIAYSLPARRAAENIVSDQYPQNCNNANAQSTLEDPESLQRFDLDLSTQMHTMRLIPYCFTTGIANGLLQQLKLHKFPRMKYIRFLLCQGVAATSI